MSHIPAIWCVETRKRSRPLIRLIPTPVSSIGLLLLSLAYEPGGDRFEVVYGQTGVSLIRQDLAAEFGTDIRQEFHEQRVVSRHGLVNGFDFTIQRVDAQDDFGCIDISALRHQKSMIFAKELINTH